MSWVFLTPRFRLFVRYMMSSFIVLSILRLLCVGKANLFLILRQDMISHKGELHLSEKQSTLFLNGIAQSSPRFVM